MQPIDTTSFYTQISETLPTVGTLVWVLLIAIIVYSAIHAGVFAYHWYAFNIAPDKFSKITQIIYFIGLAVLIGTLCISATAITASL